MSKRLLLYLICTVLLFIGPMGCVSYHYTNMTYQGKANNHYCKGNKIKINKVEDSRNINPNTWYASIRGGFNNPLIELHSVESIADNIDNMIKMALDLRGCKTDSVADYILFPTIQTISANDNNFNKEFLFRMSYMMKTTDGSVIYENKINKKKTNDKWGIGVFTDIDNFKLIIDGVVSEGVDEMIDDQKLWNSVKYYRSDKQQLTIKNKSEEKTSIAEQLKTLSELKKSGMLTDEEYQRAKGIILKKTEGDYDGIKAIVLKNGDVIEGQIISMNTETVKIRTKDGRILSYSFIKDIQTFVK